MLLPYGGIMKAVVVEEVGSFTIKDIDIPKPGPGDVLLRVNVTGLCRTDLKLIRTGHRDLILPRVPGEEVVGTVCELGEGVSGFSINQRVYVYPGTSCGHCRYCKAALVMQSIGYEKGMVVYGKDAKSGYGMDEISLSGGTVVREFTRNGCNEYTLYPEDAGLKQTPKVRIAVGKSGSLIVK